MKIILATFMILGFLSIRAEAFDVKPVSNLVWNELKNSAQYPMSGATLFNFINSVLEGQSTARGIHGYRLNLLITGIGAKGCVVHLNKTSDRSYRLSMVNVEPNGSRKTYSFQWDNSTVVNTSKFFVRSGVDTSDMVLHFVAKSDLFTKPNQAQEFYIYGNDDVRNVVGVAFKSGSETQAMCELK